MTRLLLALAVVLGGCGETPEPNAICYSEASGDWMLESNDLQGIGQCCSDKDGNLITTYTPITDPKIATYTAIKFRCKEAKGLAGTKGSTEVFDIECIGEVTQ